MNARPAKDSSHRDAAPATSREVWLLMSDLVLDNERRREVLA